MTLMYLYYLVFDYTALLVFVHWSDSQMKYCYFITYYSLPVSGLYVYNIKSVKATYLQVLSCSNTQCIELGRCPATRVPAHTWDSAAVCSYEDLTHDLTGIRGLKEDAGDYLMDSRAPQHKPTQLLLVHLTTEDGDGEMKSCYV